MVMFVFIFKGNNLKGPFSIFSFCPPFSSTIAILPQKMIQFTPLVTFTLTGNYYTSLHFVKHNLPSLLKLFSRKCEGVIETVRSIYICQSLRFFSPQRYIYTPTFSAIQKVYLLEVQNSIVEERVRGKERKKIMPMKKIPNS